MPHPPNGVFLGAAVKNRLDSVQLAKLFTKLAATTFHTVVAKFSDCHYKTRAAHHPDAWPGIVATIAQSLNAEKGLLLTPFVPGKGVDDRLSGGRLLKATTGH